MSNQIRLKRGSGSNPSASDLVVGEVALRTDNGKLFTKKDDNSITEIGSGISDGDKGDITISNSGGTFTIDNGAVTSAKILDGTIVGSDLATNVDLVDNQKIRLGTGNDLEIFHSSDQNFIKSTNGRINLLAAETRMESASGIELIARFIENGAVELYHDNSKKFETTSLGTKIIGDLWLDNPDNAGKDIQFDSSANKMKFDDNVKANFGSGDDLQIYHDGTDSFIDNSSGSLKIQGVGSNGFDVHIQARSDEEGIKLLNNSGESKVELYYDNNKKFETTSTGINVTNDITNTSGSDLVINSTGRVQLQVANGEKAVYCDNNGAVELYFDNNKKFETKSTGVIITGNDASGSENLGSFYFKTASGTVRGHFDTTNDRFALKDNILATYGNSNDLQIYHDGSNSAIVNTTGVLTLKNSGAGKLQLMTQGSQDVEIKTNNELSIKCLDDAAVELYYDASKKFETTSGGVQVTDNLNMSGGHIFLADNYKVNVGTSDDLQIYHNGSNSYIDDTGTGSLFIRSNEVRINKYTNEFMIKAIADGAVELYCDGSKKLETTAIGVTLSGDLKIPDNEELRLGDGNDLQIYHDGTRSYIDSKSTQLRIETDALRLRSDGGETYLEADANGAVQIYHDNSKKFETTNAGVAVSGVLTTSSYISIGGSQHLYLEDNGKAIFGAGSDLQIYHDGGHSYIHQDGTGTLRVLADNFRLNNEADSENIIKADANGAVELYYDNSKKLETATDRVSIYGNLSIADGSGFIMQNGFTNASVLMRNAGGSTDGNFEFLTRTGGGSLVEALEITKDSHIRIVNDSKQLRLGAGDDFRLEHDGSHSYISNYTGNLYFRTVSNETSAIFKPNGAVELYHDNSLKLNTESWGVQVTGALQTSSHIYLGDNDKVIFGAGEDLQIYHDSVDNNIKGTGNHIMRFWTNNTIRWNILNDGHFRPEADNSYDIGASNQRVRSIFASNALDMADNAKVQLGNSDDLQIFHDGGDNHIDSPSNAHKLKIQAEANIELRRAGANEVMAAFSPNVGVQLYFDNALKLSTLSSGVQMANGSGNNTFSIFNSDKLSFGNSGELKIFHNGTNSFIQDTAGASFSITATESIAIKTNNTEFAIACNKNGGVELYNDNSKKLETTGTGINVSASVPTIALSDTDGNTPYSRITAGGGDLVFEADQGDEEGNTLMLFRVDDSEKMRIASDGNVGIGKSSTSLDVDGFIVFGNGQAVQAVKSGSGGKILTLNRRTNVGLSIEFFRGSSVGSISHNNSSTAYNTTSDYRLKENVVTLSDAITRLKTLKPYRFNFKVDKDTTVDGFLAHEVTAVPEAITGTKDAVITQEMIDNEEYEENRLGEILPQGIDQAKLVPLLVAAVQEAISKIELLETEVASLKAS